MCKNYAEELSMKRHYTYFLENGYEINIVIMHRYSFSIIRLEKICTPSLFLGLYLLNKAVLRPLVYRNSKLIIQRIPNRLTFYNAAERRIKLGLLNE